MTYPSGRAQCWLSGGKACCLSGGIPPLPRPHAWCSTATAAWIAAPPCAAPKALEGPFSLAAILAYIVFFALGAG